MATFIDAIVKNVLSGDTVVIVQPGVPGDRLFTLAHLSAPRIHRKQPTGETTPDEPYAFAAREFVRKMVVGKRIKLRVDWTAEQRHDFGAIFLPSPNSTQETSSLGFEVVGNGWARVRPGQEGRQSPDFNTLQELEEAAKHAKVGIWNPDEAARAAAVRQIEYPTEAEVAALFERVKGSPKPVCVEAVLSGNLIRVQLKGAQKYYIFLVSFTGIQIPSAKVEPGQQPTLDQQVSAEARTFTEQKLLNRDIGLIFEGVERDVMLASVVGAQANHTFSEELLARGLAKCADRTMARTAFAPQLRNAERAAKAKKLGFWHSYVAQSADAPAGSQTDLTGTVIEVVGDVIVLKVGNSERRIYLSSVRLPKRDADYFYEAKEFLRKRLVGKTVTALFDYARKPPPAAESANEGSSAAPAASARNQEMRYFYTINLEDGDIGESLVKAGLADVTPGQDRSRNIDALLAAEQQAKSQKKNKWSNKPAPQRRIKDLTQKGDSHVSAKKAVEKAKELLPFLQRSKRTAAQVDFCLSASRFKLFVPSQNTLLVFALSGIRTPSFSRGSDRESEPFGEEALQFTREHVNQRDVEVEIEGVDRSGAFLGYIFFDRNKNLSVELLKHGYASTYGPVVERSDYSNVLLESETSARNRNLNIWSIPRPEEPSRQQQGPSGVGARGLRVAGETGYAPVRVTEVPSPTSLFIHLLDATVSIDEAMDKLSYTLEQMQAECTAYAEGSISGPVHNPRAGNLCLAKFSADGGWYRAKITKVLPGQATVLFIDYGNSETTQLTELRTISAELAGLPAQAKFCRLAGVNPPPQDSEFFEEATIFVQEAVVDRSGVTARIEYVDREDTCYLSVTYDDGEDLSTALVSEGLGRADKDVAAVLPAMYDTLLNAEQDARSFHRNLWRYGDYEGEEEQP